jgi:hypothetical protein
VSEDFSIPEEGEMNMNVTRIIRTCSNKLVVDKGNLRQHNKQRFLVELDTFKTPKSNSKSSRYMSNKIERCSTIYQQKYNEVEKKMKFSSSGNYMLMKRYGLIDIGEKG